MFRAIFFKSLFFFWYRFLFRQLKSLLAFHRTLTNTFSISSSNFKYHKFPSLLHRTDLEDRTLVLDVENVLLRSSDLFPYFMLVAFEVGGLMRAVVLVLLYPFACLAGRDTKHGIMVMICFFGIRAESFRVGRSVLPKFFLEDVGSEVFDVVSRGGKRVGVTDMPRVMVESFLREYLEIDVVVGREMKVFCGYFVGLMEERGSVRALEQVQEGKGCSDMIGITGFNTTLHHDLFSHCKEVYAVSGSDKRSWQKLSKDKYPKPLIFHDGRLSLRPTFVESLAMLMWLPYAFTLSIIRISLALSLPYHLSTPLLIMTGIHLTTSPITPKKMKNKNNNNNGDGHSLYVCNHRTLLDPLYISFALQRDLIAVTYSLSRMSEILAPIKTVRLTRDRDQDARMMKELLGQGDLVVCPEGTTCREPYLLRFSPLFSEMCDDISPVAVDSHVGMFHGTTAGGLKCLDPVFFLMNPSPVYTVKMLEPVNGSGYGNDNHSRRFEVANRVQTEIGDALGFECTRLTRKDKYLILAGNEGVVLKKSSK